MIKTIRIKNIIIPDWYIMLPISDEDKIIMKKSIERYGYGSLVVRNNNELIDGRKRLKIMKELRYSVADCVYYPKLSDLGALLLIRNLHYEWSQIDVLEFSELLNMSCTKKDIYRIAKIIPEEREEIKNVLNLIGNKNEKN